MHLWLEFGMFKCAHTYSTMNASFATCKHKMQTVSKLYYENWYNVATFLSKERKKKKKIKSEQRKRNNFYSLLFLCLSSLQFLLKPQKTALYACFCFFFFPIEVESETKKSYNDREKMRNNNASFEKENFPIRICSVILLRWYIPIDHIKDWNQ